jgi:hypothetical protein
MASPAAKIEMTVKSVATGDGMAARSARGNGDPQNALSAISQRRNRDPARDPRTVARAFVEAARQIVERGNAALKQQRQF